MRSRGTPVCSAGMNWLPCAAGPLEVEAAGAGGGGMAGRGAAAGAGTDAGADAEAPFVWLGHHAFNIFLVNTAAGTAALYRSQIDTVLLGHTPDQGRRVNAIGGPGRWCRYGG